MEDLNTQINRLRLQLAHKDQQLNTMKQIARFMAANLMENRKPSPQIQKVAKECLDWLNYDNFNQ